MGGDFKEGDTDEIMPGKDNSSSVITHVDVDQIWKALGRYGRYQLRQMFFIYVGYWSCVFHLLSIVFIAYRPTYECQHSPTHGLVSNATNINVEYGKCSVTVLYNTSGTLTKEESECTSGWNYSYSDVEDYPAERSLISEWNLVCAKGELPELTQTLLMFGQIFGSFFCTSLADKYGRKPVYVVCHILIFLTSITTAFLPNYTSFAVMRLLTGAAIMGTALVGAIVNLEMVPMEIRSNVEVVGLLFWSTGIALITPLAYIFRNMSWRYLQICLSCLSAWSLIEWWLIDESLRWLIANGKYARAKAIIKKACKVNKKDYGEVMKATAFERVEMVAMKAKEKDARESSHFVQTGTPTHAGDVANGKEHPNLATKKYTIIDLVKSKHLLSTSLVLWFAWTTDSLTYYGLYLISSNLAGNRFLNFFLGTVVEYPAAFMEYHIFNRFGRKVASVMFHSICCVALLTATVLTTTANGSQAMLLGATAFTLIGKFAITGSFSTLFLYTPELYPTNMRNVGIGLSSAAGRIGSMLAPFSRNLMEVTMWAPGLVFGIMCAIVSVLMIFMPETNQRELPMTLAETEVWHQESKFRMPGTKKEERKKDVTE